MAVVGDAAGAEQMMREAIEAFAARGDLIGESKAQIGLSAISANLKGDSITARDQLLKVVEMLAGLPPAAERAEALGELALNAMILGHPHEGVAYAQESLEIAEELGDRKQIVYAKGALGLVRAVAGDPDGISDLRFALAGGLEQGILSAVLSSYANLGEVLWIIEDAQSGLECYREGIEYANQRGLVAWVAWITVMSLGARFDLGHWDEVLRSDEELATSEDVLHGYYNWYPRAQRAHVLLVQGDLDEAAALVNGVLDDAAVSNDPQTLLPPCTVVALVAQARGDSGLVDRCIDTIAKATPREGLWFRAMELPYLARLCVGAGRPDTLRELMADVGERAARHRSALLSARAALAEHEDDTETALALYQGAAEAWESHGSILERGYALLGAARCSLTLRQPAAADRLGAGQRAIQRPWRGDTRGPGR